MPRLSLIIATVGSAATAIGVTFGVVVSLWSLAIAPIQAQVAGVGESVIELKTEWRESRVQLAKQLEDRVKDMDKNLDQINRRLENLESRPVGGR